MGTPLAGCVVGESANVAENVEVPPVQYYIIPLYILQLFTSLFHILLQFYK